MATLMTTDAAAVQIMMRRLSTESPTGPALSAPRRNGMSWARLIRPTCNDEWVMEYTW